MYDQFGNNISKLRKDISKINPQEMILCVGQFGDCRDYCLSPNPETCWHYIMGKPTISEINKCRGQ